MIERHHGYLRARTKAAPAESLHLEAHGYTILEQVFSPAEVDALANEINDVFTREDADTRGGRDATAANMFRYEMLNRSALAQQAIAH